jgi:hypothetical protein
MGTKQMSGYEKIASRTYVLSGLNRPLVLVHVLVQEHCQPRICRKERGTDDRQRSLFRHRRRAVHVCTGL